MVLGIGTDLLEISRIEKSIENEKFIQRIFTKSEVDFAEKTARKGEIYAGSFASKEAVSKALGTGIRGFNFRDIEILREESGKPYVKLHNGAKILADEFAVKNIFLSITHTVENCLAFCVIEG